MCGKRMVVQNKVGIYQVNHGTEENGKLEKLTKGYL